MYFAQVAPSLWPYLIPAVPALLLAVAALLGWWNAKRKQPAEHRLITAQTEQVESDIIHRSVEASVRTGEFTLKALQIADATIDRLRAEKGVLETKLEGDVKELRQKVNEVDEKQAEIFLILGERSKAERREEEG